MARLDVYGCSVALEDTAALESWNACMHGFLSHGASTGDHLAKTLELDPNFALAHACKGIFKVQLSK